MACIRGCYSTVYQLIISLLKIGSSDCYQLWKKRTHFFFICLHSPVLNLLFYQCIAVFQRVSRPQSHEFKKNKMWDIVPT